MSSTVSWSPPCESQIALACFLPLPAPGSQVLSEALYVPPAAVHSLDVLIEAVLEHAASGSASRATMAVVNNIFLEPIVTSCWLVDGRLAVLVRDPHGPDPCGDPVSSAALGGIPAAYLSASR